MSNKKKDPSSKNNIVSKIAIMLGRNKLLLDAITFSFLQGITYIPINPDLPDERIAAILEESKPDAVITTNEYKDRTHNCKTIVINDDETIDFEGNDPDDEIAYIMYTSGSTGRPKGVMVRRESVYNFMDGVSEIIDFSEGRSIACLTNVSFDIFFLESVMPLLKGMKVYLATEEEQNNPKAIASLIENSQVDMLQMTPSRMQLLLNYDKDLSCLKNVKDIMIGGEAFPEKLLHTLQEKTNANIYNMYGPTETTIWSTISDLTNKDTVDIGKPIKDTRVYIVDHNLHIVPNGEIGEICIAGKGLAKGYVNNEELTKEKFCPLPEKTEEIIYRTGDLGRVLPSGDLICLGRTDSQVKIRGHRIELGEIEFFINQVDGIIQAVTTVAEKSENEKIIETYYTCSKPITHEQISEYLSKKVPAYMIPAKYYEVDSFELTPNGKIDRNNLQSPIVKTLYNNSSSVPSVQNNSKAFETIAATLSESLEIPVESIRFDAPLSELDLDSINFVKLVIILEMEFNFEFDDDKLLISEFPTVQSLVEYVDEKYKCSQEVN